MDNIPWNEIDDFSLRVNNVASILNVSEDTVYRMIKHGKLKARKDGERQTRISRQSVDKIKNDVNGK